MNKNSIKKVIRKQATKEGNEEACIKIVKKKKTMEIDKKKEAK